MLLCTDCLHADDRNVDHCPACGGSAFAKVTKNGDLVTVPADAGMPCQGCLEGERDLALRYYRRVLGLLVMDRMWAEAGYFCGPCRRKRFTRNMAFTLVLGWWGVLAMIFRNPYAIVVNVWALFAPPFGAGEFGAMNAHEIRDTAASEQDREQRLADVYMRMPGWMESLSDDDVERVLVNTDYYAVLGVAVTASHSEIKTAWREQVKAHHPDRAGAVGHERMVGVNDAWQVLGDERLRHAFDHRDELLAFLQDAEAVASEFDQDESDDADFVMVVGCIDCRLGFASFDDAADHVDEIHPDTDYSDLLVSLIDDDDEDQPTTDLTGPSARWQCKTCASAFTDYDEAVAHADRAHPERVTVDPRSAVEAV